MYFLEACTTKKWVLGIEHYKNLENKNAHISEHYWNFYNYFMLMYRYAGLYKYLLNEQGYINV